MGLSLYLPTMWSNYETHLGYILPKWEVEKSLTTTPMHQETYYT